jgi:hypothetical protein
MGFACGRVGRIARRRKGKVERPIRYLRESFLYGRTFLSDADLNAQAIDWLATVANVRTHATTKWIPATRFAEVESATLTPLPAQPDRSRVLPLGSHAPAQRETTALPKISVERRELAVYEALTAVGGEL